MPSPSTCCLADPKILLLNIELELKSEKENAEVRLDDPTQYQVRGAVKHMPGSTPARCMGVWGWVGAHEGVCHMRCRCMGCEPGLAPFAGSLPLPGSTMLLDVLLPTHPPRAQSIVDAEWNIIYDKLDKCIASGAQIVLSRLAIGDLATQYFADRGVFCAGRVPEEDMQRVSKATGEGGGGHMGVRLPGTKFVQRQGGRGSSAVQRASAGCPCARTSPARAILQARACRQRSMGWTLPCWALALPLRSGKSAPTATTSSQVCTQ